MAHRESPRGKRQSLINSKPIAGPDNGNTGPSDPDEVAKLESAFGPADENGLYGTNLNQDVYADDFEGEEDE